MKDDIRQIDWFVLSHSCFLGSIVSPEQISSGVMLLVGLFLGIKGFLTEDDKE